MRPENEQQRQWVSVAVQILFFAGLSIPRRRDCQARSMSVLMSGGGHRGHRYGTLIVNLDTHHPLALLPGREQCTLATRFRKYPEIQVVSRDRSGVYATAACEGAPQARQVADRWHLLNNIDDAPERMMNRHIPLILLLPQRNHLSHNCLCLQHRSVVRNALNSKPAKNGISVGQRLWPCITRDVVSGKYPVLQACRV